MFGLPRPSLPVTGVWDVPSKPPVREHPASFMLVRVHSSLPILPLSTTRGVALKVVMFPRAGGVQVFGVGVGVVSPHVPFVQRYLHEVPGTEMKQLPAVLL